MPRKLYTWKLKHRELRLGERTLIVGVLNVTPDSFSDGGLYQDPDRAFARAIEMEEQGADIIDIGAESTKPGSSRISAAEEIRRLIPVLKRLKGELRIPISVDTYKAEVAELAIEHGAEIINDPSGFTWDPLIAKTVVQADAGLILNHMRGTPETWGKLGPIPDVMLAVTKDLDASISRARRSGVDRLKIVLDPGLGFGKRKEQNAEILARLAELAKLEYPILVGPSRKAFLAQATELETRFATAAAAAAAVLSGAHLVRVHDILEIRAALAVADEILRVVPQAEVHEQPRKASPHVSAPSSRPSTPRLNLLRPIAPKQPPAPQPMEKQERPPRPQREQRPERNERPQRSFPPRSGPPRSGPPRTDRPFDSRPPRSGPPKNGPPRGGPPRGGPPRSGRPFDSRSSRSGPPRGGPPRKRS